MGSIAVPVHTPLPVELLTRFLGALRLRHMRQRVVGKVAWASQGVVGRKDTLRGEEEEGGRWRTVSLVTVSSQQQPVWPSVAHLHMLALIFQFRWHLRHGVA